MTSIQQRLSTGRGKFTPDYPELGTGPVNYEDEGYRRTATHASLLGFDGKWAIHPSQVPVANEVFTPTADEIAEANAIIADYRRRSARVGRDRARWQTRRRRDDASRRECASKGSHMTASEKVGSRDSATRDKMLDATIHIMLEEGYAAATSRRVAALAGVKPALVHYYFPTMDELYLAVFRRGAAANLDRHQEALASDRPLHAFWETVSEPGGTRLLLEFMGLANHRKKIRAEISAWSERWREMQITALNFIVRQSGMDAAEFPPAAFAVVVASIGRTLCSSRRSAQRVVRRGDSVGQPVHRPVRDAAAEVAPRAVHLVVVRRAALLRRPTRGVSPPLNTDRGRAMHGDAWQPGNPIGRHPTALDGQSERSPLLVVLRPLWLGGIRPPSRLR